MIPLRICLFTQPKEAGVRMLVQAPVGNVTFMCPPAVATYEEFSCNATVFRGTYISAGIDWDDPDGDYPTDSFGVASEYA